MTLHRLLGFTTAVPDPLAVASLYSELGLNGDDVAGFTGCDGGAAIRLDEGKLRQLIRVDIGCSADEDLSATAHRLISAGAAPSIRGDELRIVDPPTSVEFVVRVAEPTKIQKPPPLVVPNAPGATVRTNERAPAVFGRPRAPRRLGHLVIGTPAIARTRDLLCLLGLKVSDELDGLISFLRCSPDHHNVALVDAPVPFLQHYSFECDDIDHVGHTATALIRPDSARHAWGLGRHFAGSNFYWYLRDPAGAFLELYADMDQILDEAEWETKGRTPFDLDHVVNAWGPNVPLEFVEPVDLPVLKAAWAAR